MAGAAGVPDAPARAVPPRAVHHHVQVLDGEARGPTQVLRLGGGDASLAGEHLTPPPWRDRKPEYKLEPETISFIPERFSILQ